MEKMDANPYTQKIATTPAADPEMEEAENE